ncbi:hypothetical protein D3C75_912130 [compost metagenome]
MLQLNHLADDVADAQEKRIAKHHEIQPCAPHGLPAAPSRGDEVTQQHVAFEARNGAVVGIGPQHLGQSGARHGRHVHPSVAGREHAQVFADVAGQHRLWRAEAERLHFVRLGIGLFEFLHGCLLGLTSGCAAFC